MARGSMRQRGRDTWQLRVYLGTDPDTGRRRWLTKTVHGTRRFASGQLKAFVEEADYARLRAGTLNELLERWYEAASPWWAPTTVSHARSAIRCYLKPHLGHLPVSKLTTPDIDDFYGHLLRGGGRRGQPLTPGTVTPGPPGTPSGPGPGRPVGLDLAQPGNEREAAAGGTRGDPPTQPTSRGRAPQWDSGERAAAVLFPAAGRINRGPQEPTVGLAVGCRRSGASRHRFTRGWVQGLDGPELRSTKTHRTYRVELDRETLDAVVAHRASVEAWAGQAGVELTGSSFLFSSEPDGGSPWRPNWTTKRFIRARRAADLPHFQLRELRLFMATEMLAAGVPIATVSQRLGHARVSTTLNVYSHAVPGGDRRAAETLARILAKGP